MPNQKEKYLAEAAEAAEELFEIDQARGEVRARLVKAVAGAYDLKATQQEIGDHTGYSRQRISQFLAEVKS